MRQCFQNRLFVFPPMSSRRMPNRGQIAIVFTLVIASLIGVMALGSDVGVLYYNSIQLQKAADAAALAGAGYFGPNNPPTPTCSWGSNAQNAACDYVVSNGIAKGYITDINSPATGVASVPAGAQSVQVKLKRTDIPVFFGRLIGLSNLAAIGNATAIGPMPIQTLTRGLFPVGVQYPATMSYGTNYTLSEKSSGQFGPGNWGWLNFPQCSPIGSTPPAVSHGGGVPNLTANVTNGSTCAYSVGSTITPETGAKGNSTQPANAINARIGSGNPPPTDPNQISISDPQLVIVPLVDWNNNNGQSSTVQVKGFAAFWLMSLTGQGAAITLTGQFVKAVDNYGIGGTGTSWGAFSAPVLVQ
jgi:Putative Flp pilus-assembly TadE/G-like